MKRSQFVSTMVLTFIAITPAFAAYKCKDTSGRIIFQQIPCENGQVQTELNIKAPAPLTVAEQRIIRATATGKVTRGMTAAQVQSSWGSPSKINKSIGSYGLSEQWIYDRGNFRSQYVYLENGIVTGAQSPE